MSDKRIVVLVVDDDVTALETYRQMLAAEGYVVRTAETVELAVTDALTHRPDVMLVDLHMPGVNGVECLKRIRAGTLPVPAAILTGDYFVDEAVAREIKSLGARIHFKPLWDDDLIRLVADLLDAGVFSRAQQSGTSSPS